MKEVLGSIEVVVGLHPSLERFVSPHPDAMDFHGRLEQFLHDLIEDLRLPLEFTLNIALCEEAGRFPLHKTLYEVTVGGHRCRHELQTRTAEIMSSASLAQAAASDICRNRDLMLTPALSEAIRQRWISEKAASYCAAMAAREFHDLLSLLVQRGSRLDRTKEADQATDERKQQMNVRQRFEAIAASTGATSVRVLLSDDQYQRFLGEGTESRSSVDTRSFQSILDRLDADLFYELGILLPSIVVSVEGSLADTEFQFQINDLRLPRMGGLREDQLLVAATPEELHRIGITGQKAVNFATGERCALVEGGEQVRERCRRAFAAQGPAELAGLSLTAELRRNASRLLTTEVVECNLDLLRDSFPALVHATLQRFDVLTLTGIMRDLMREEISTRNLRAVLESLLSIPGMKAASGTEITRADSFDESYLIWPRADLKRYISNKYGRGRNTLVVHLLDSRLEARIAASDCEGLSEEERGQLLQSLSRVVDELSGKGHTVVILATAEARRKLRRLVEIEFPAVAVLGYQELSPDLNIQPAARIELAATTTARSSQLENG